jgi:hypothetical protein
MTNNSNIDKLSKDILKQSYIEVSDPGFNQIVMKKVLREDRKQQIRQNLLMCFFAFVAIDVLILLVFWLLGLNAFEIAIRSESISQNLFLLIDKIKDSILYNRYIGYIFLPIVLLAMIGLIAESKIRLLHKKK